MTTWATPEPVESRAGKKRSAIMRVFQEAGDGARITTQGVRDRLPAGKVPFMDYSEVASRLQSFHFDGVLDRHDDTNGMLPPSWSLR